MGIFGAAGKGRFLPAAMAGIALVAGFSACGGAADGSAGVHLEKAESLIESGDFEAAYAHLNRARALDPNDPDVHHNLGWFYIYKDEPDKAKAELERLAAIAPDSAATYHLRGGLFSRLNRQEEAVENFEKAITLDKQEEKGDLVHGANPRLYFDLATSLSAMQQHEKALKALQEGFRHTPDDDVTGRANFQVAICSEYYNLKDYEKAHGYCEDALEITEDPEERDRIEEFVENMKLAQSLEGGESKEVGEYQEPTGSD